MNTKVFASGISMQMDLEHRKTKTKSKKRSGSLLSGSPPTAQSSPLSSSPSKRKSSATLKVDNSSNKSPHVKSNNNTTSNTNNNSSSDSDEDMKQYGAFGWKHLYFNKSQVENLGWLANKRTLLKKQIRLWVNFDESIFSLIWYETQISLRVFTQDFLLD